jgi:hypothetical protein
VAGPGPTFDERGDSGLGVVQKAWRATCIDYGRRRLNSERALQASFYHHLRNGLYPRGDDYVIFIEAKVILPAVAEDLESGIQASPQQRIFVDMLVCVGDTIVAAVELKYAPRNCPDVEGIRKDLESLSHIRNRTARENRVRIHVERHGETSVTGALKLLISPHTKLLLGFYCSENTEINAERFWRDHRPFEGRWHKVSSLPKKLGLCVAYAPQLQDEDDAGRKAKANFIGGAFLNPGN